MLHALITDLQDRRDEEKRINLELAELVHTRLEAVTGLYNLVSEIFESLIDLMNHPGVDSRQY